MRQSRREFLSKAGKFAALSGVAAKYFGDIPEINVAIYEDSETENDYAQKFFDDGYPSIINDMFLDIGVSVNFEGPFTTEFSGKGAVDELPAAGPLTTNFSGEMGGKANDWNAIHNEWKHNAPNKSSFSTVHSRMLISRTRESSYIGIGDFHFVPCTCSHANTAIAWVGRNRGFSAIQWTVAHELGHNIGLHHGHANANLKPDAYTKSIMYSDEITQIGVNSFGQPQPDYETIEDMDWEFTHEFNDKITSRTTNIRSLK